jgi:hypothetical protein
MLTQDEGLTAPLRAVSQPDRTSPAAQLRRPGTVKARLTPKRPRPQVENDEYGVFVRHVLRAYSRRVGDGDVEALVLLVGLGQEINAAIAEAVKACVLMATPGPRSAHGSASASRPYSSAGAHLDPAAKPGRPNQPRARCMPDEAANRGYWQSLADTSVCPLACTRAGQRMAAHVLLSNGSAGQRLAAILTGWPTIRGHQPRSRRLAAPALRHPPRRSCRGRRSAPSGFQPGVRENASMMNMVAMGGPSGWRMNIGTSINPDSGPSPATSQQGVTSRG